MNILKLDIPANYNRRREEIEVAMSALVVVSSLIGEPDERRLTIAYEMGGVIVYGVSDSKCYAAGYQEFTYSPVEGLRRIVPIRVQPRRETI